MGANSFPFVGGSYTARSRTFDAQRTLNLYPEVSGSGTSRSVSALYGTPGLALWASLVGGPVRGLLRFTQAQAVAVVGSTIYTLTTAGVGVAIGSISAGTAPVSMASNGGVVMLAAGAAGYFIDPAAGTVTQITDPDFVGAGRVDYIDGYFVWTTPGTGRFQISQLLGTGIDGLDFATAEGAPDNLLSLVVDHRELWLFGETSTEVWFNSGNIDFPFERIQGAFMEIGCAAATSVAKLDNTVFWLGADDRGQGMVMRAQGYQPQRVSTHAVEYAIGQMSVISDAVAYTYQQEGHSFYVLNFPTAGQTWVYDASTDQWHERAWRDPLLGTLGRHRAQVHMAFAGENIVGDWETGNLYRLDLDTYSDNGAPIVRTRRCAHIASGGGWQFFSSLQLIMETGVGLASGQGSDPQAMLRWSDDGGLTWSSEAWVSMGRMGEYKRRALWRRLGKGRDRVFEVTITDPVKAVIVDAVLQVEAGR
jgi:hypothetical protein